MGGRYLVTGVQLGLLKASLDPRSSADGRKLASEQLDFILERQFLGDSDKTIEEDVENFEKRR